MNDEDEKQQIPPTQIPKNIDVNEQIVSKIPTEHTLHPIVIINVHHHQIHFLA